MHSPNCQYLFFQRIPNTTRLSLQQSKEALLLCPALFSKYKLDCSFFEFIRDSLNYRKWLKFLEILKNHKRKGPQSINTLYSRTLLYRVFFCSPTCAMHFNTKGQIISNSNYGMLNSPKKRTNKFDFTTMIPQVNLFSFVFLRKLKTPKRHFEINWPLVCENSAFFLPGILPGRNKIHRQVEIVSIGGKVILKPIMEPNFTTIHNWMLLN